MELLHLLLLTLVTSSATSAMLSKTKKYSDPTNAKKYKNDFMTKSLTTNHGGTTEAAVLSSGPLSDDDGTTWSDSRYHPDSSGCPAGLESRCVCGVATYQHHEKYVVNCSHAGFTDAEPLRWLPDLAEVLLFVGNFVDELPPNVFGTESNFDDLETVDMSDNGITEIDGQAFHRVSGVTTLILSHNQLNIVEKQLHPRVFSNFDSLESLHLTDAFSGSAGKPNQVMDSLKTIFQESELTQLKKLHLEQNNINRINDSGIFCSLPVLEHLYLGRNRLTDFTLDLSCLRRLSYLDLQYNSLRRLDVSATARLDCQAAVNPAFSFRLTGNPFVCDCQLEPLRRWLLRPTTFADGHEDYTCFGTPPAHYAGHRIMQLQPLTCPLEAAPVAGGGGGGSGGGAVVPLLLLVLAVCVLLSAVIWRRRRRLPLLPTPLQAALDSLCRGRHYTNVDSQEEAPPTPL